MTAFKVVSWSIACYLIGSIPFGLIASRAFYRKDVRSLGSGNIGATNMLRNFGMAAFVAVLLLDALKGVFAVWIARALGLDPAYVLLAGACCIAGHDWSIYLRFKGGKGIATSAGVILAAFPWQVSVAVIGAFLVLVIATRYMSLASLTAATTLPVATALMFRGDLGNEWPYLAFSLAAMAMAFWRHKENIRRLAAGEESRINLKRKIAEETS